MFVKSESGARLTKILPKLLQTKDMDAVLKVSILNPFWGAAAMHPMQCILWSLVHLSKLFLLNSFPLLLFYQCFLKSYILKTVINLF